jgi:hypothetical protein
MIGGFNMHYQVNAYLCTNFAGLMESLETDDFYEVQDFIWKHCQEGLNCELIDTETGDRKLAYADSFTEATEDADELLSDLHMEQLEQM